VAARSVIDPGLPATEPLPKIPLDRPEQCPNVIRSEAFRTASLHKLDEESASLEHGTCKGLQQKARVFSVDENITASEALDMCRLEPKPFAQLAIIGLRNGQQFKAGLTRALGGGEDIIDPQGDMLNAGAPRETVSANSSGRTHIAT
jgi:hypothetical protein